MNQKVNMKELFLDMQQEMLLRLNSIRKHITHAPTKGEEVERRWIHFLSEYLPNRYCVDKAFIVDHTGARSDQIDLVIYDKQYSPFVFLHGGVKLIPAESVYAVFEIKQVLNKKHIEEAAKKAESVRTLKRTSVPIVHAGGTYSPRPNIDIVAGLITTSYDWSLPFGNPFYDVMGTLEPLQRLNIGCTLDSGSYILQTDESFEISTPEEALIFFYIKLFTKLQNTGTVPAMDIDLYSRALDSM